MPFLGYTEECGYIVRLAENIAGYVDVASCNFPATNLDLAAFDKPLDWMHMYNSFDYWVKETIFERHLRTSGDNLCFIN